jgi:hypothetical protein
VNDGFTSLRLRHQKVSTPSKAITTTTREASLTNPSPSDSTLPISLFSLLPSISQRPHHRMNPSFSSSDRRPIDISHQQPIPTPTMSASALVMSAQDSLADISSSTFTRSSPLTAFTQKPVMMNASSFYLPTPPSTSPPSPRAKQLPTTVLSSFTNGSAESVMHAQIKALAEGNAMDGVDGDEGAFFVGDLGEVWKAWKSWVTELSRVELFYGSLEFLPLLCLKFRKDLAD